MPYILKKKYVRGRVRVKNYPNIKTKNIFLINKKNKKNKKIYIKKLI